jgi:hypothetical protein
MIQRFETVGSILNKWNQPRHHYLPWPDELMSAVGDATMLNHASDALETEWEKDWIDIGGEG